MVGTNRVSRECNFAAIFQLQIMPHVILFPMLNVLYFYIITFTSMCADPNMALFCNSLNLCFPGMLLRYFLNKFEIVPFAPITTNVTPLVYIPHKLYFFYYYGISLLLMLRSHLPFHMKLYAVYT